MTRIANRSGMTLVELLVGLVIGGLVLQGVVGFFISQTRIVGENESRRTAREASRTAMHVFLGDLRRVEATGGVVEASASAVTVRVPFALGVVCETDGFGTTLTLLPTDSARYVNAVFSGYAWRSDATGGYTYVTPATLSLGTVSTCTGAGLKVFAHGGVLTVVPSAAGATMGTPLFLYQIVRYAFEPSGAGARLVRTIPGQSPEVLVETFAAGTRFRFFRAGSSVPEDLPPADLAELRGLQLDLDGLGDRPAPGGGPVATAPLRVSVFFKNRPAI